MSAPESPPTAAGAPSHDYGMFTSGPAPMYPGNGWQTLIELKDGSQLWWDVILLLPTETSVDVLVAVPGSPPCWFRNVEMRRAAS